MNLVEEFKTKPNEKTSFLLVNCEFLVQAQRNTERVPIVESFLKVKIENTKYILTEFGGSRQEYIWLSVMTYRPTAKYFPIRPSLLVNKNIVFCLILRKITLFRHKQCFAEVLLCTMLCRNPRRSWEFPKDFYQVK